MSCAHALCAPRNVFTLFSDGAPAISVDQLHGLMETMGLQARG